MIRIKLKSIYVLGRPMNGNTFSPELQARVDLLQKYLTNLYVYGVTPKTAGGITTAELTHDAEREFDLDHYGLGMSFPGTTIEGFKPYIKIAEIDINKPVPEGLTNSSYPFIPETEDIDGTIIPATPLRVKTWHEYFLNYNRNGIKGNYTPTLRHDGFVYYHVIGSKSGVALTGAELLQVQACPEVTLTMTLPEIEEQLI